MNQTLTSLLQCLQSLKKRISTKPLILVVAVLLVIFATGLSLMTLPPPPEPVISPPAYVHPRTWKIVTFPTGNSTVVQMSLPQAPTLLSEDETGSKRYCYANQHLILVCATAPLAVPLNLPEPAASQQEGQKAVTQKALAELRALTRDALQQELSSARLKEQPLHLSGNLEYTPCLYRDQHADFFTGKTLPNQGEQKDSLDITGRIFYLRDALVYVYAFSNSDLGKMLAEKMLATLAFSNVQSVK